MRLQGAQVRTLLPENKLPLSLESAKPMMKYIAMLMLLSTTFCTQIEFAIMRKQRSWPCSQRLERALQPDSRTLCKQGTSSAQAGKGSLVASSIVARD